MHKGVRARQLRQAALERALRAAPTMRQQRRRQRRRHVLQRLSAEQLAARAGLRLLIRQQAQRILQGKATWELG